MLSLSNIGARVARKREDLGLSQTELARKAQIGRSTLAALENARIGELGYSKILRLITALGLELKLQDAGSSRPTLEDLLKEDDHD